jgi:pantothenate kinase type III
MIVHLLEAVRKELGGGGPVPVILTGGTAGLLIKEKLPEAQWVPMLTLEGLAVAFQRTFPAAKF